MNNFFRALIAGYGAKKLGGGCFGTIVVFILIWVALGQCSFSSRQVPPPQTFPAKHRVCAPLPTSHIDSFISQIRTGHVLPVSSLDDLQVVALAEENCNV